MEDQPIRYRVRRIARGNNVGQFGFSILADNNRVVATSGSETYHNLEDLRNTARRISGPDVEFEYAWEKK